MEIEKARKQGFRKLNNKVFGERPIYKIALLGDTNVGKTAFIKCFVEGNDFNNIQSEFTVGTYISVETFVYGKLDVTLEIFDIGGYERYMSLASLYLRNSKAVLLMFSWDIFMLDENLDVNIGRYIKLARESEPNCPIIVVGNKSDLIRRFGLEHYKRIVDDYIATYGIGPCLVISVKEGTGMEKIFPLLIHSCGLKDVHLDYSISEPSDPSVPSE